VVTSLLSEKTAALAEIAGAVGTPVYVYDAGAVRARYQELVSALAPTPHRIYYSVKANSNLAMLGLLRRLGAGADIVSAGELARARRAGFDPTDIVFSGVGKTANELSQALAERVSLVNVESFAELRLLNEIARAEGVVAPFGIRVNPDVPTPTHPYTQTGDAEKKFGTPVEDVLPMVHWSLEQPGLEFLSLGMHLGSQISEAEPFREGAERIGRMVCQLLAEGVTSLRSVDVGGGLGIQYRSERPLAAEAFAAAVRPLHETTGLPLIVEPGRCLVGNAGLLLTRCLYRKPTGEREFVITDAAMNDLLRPSLYGAEHDVRVVEGAEQVGAASDASGPGRVDVVGPICESGDFLALDRELPEAVPGALLAVSGAGAYGFTMSSSYNSRPRAAEVLLDGERWAVVRRRETFEDLIRGERLLEDTELGAIEQP
jgi:diaminopimelate decarboxylase